jgi:nucleotide-binding universal stress UspA family protein
MTHVVLAVDDDEERAELQAERLTDLDWAPDGLQVTILHVFTRNDEGASITQYAPARAARDHLEAAGVEVTLDERSGDPGTQVVEYAEEDVDADVISVAGRKRSPAGKAVFGSVSQTVMLDAEIPVFFCPFRED